MLYVMWHKRDLRVIGNNALEFAFNDASGGDQILPIYVHEPSLLKTAEVSAQHKGFIDESLECLAAQYKSLAGNPSLLVTTAEVAQVLTQIRASCGPFVLVSNQEITHQAGFDRDKAVARWCLANSVTWVQAEQNGVRRGSIRKAKGDPAFGEHIKSLCFDKPLFNPSALPQSSRARFLTQASELGLNLSMDLLAVETPYISALPAGSQTPQLLSSSYEKANRVRGGRTEMLKHLGQFLSTSRFMDYPGQMSSPVTAAAVCSRLSAYLAYGVISDQELFLALQEFMDREESTLSSESYARLKGCAQFFSERLYWRHMYLRQAESYPDMRHLSLAPALDESRSRLHFEPWFEAWKTGNTGVPIVDAVMRWLLATGWINMRMRGMLASFALNDLWLDRDQVSMHLARHFLDFEPAIHHAQIAIHAGCSSGDPLIYDAVKQSKTLDSTGAFIRHWVPELKEVPDQYIHEPHKMSVALQAQIGVQIGSHYPQPIVEPQLSFTSARDRVHAARQGKPVPESAYWSRVLKSRVAGAYQDSLF